MRKFLHIRLTLLIAVIAICLQHSCVRSYTTSSHVPEYGLSSNFLDHKRTTKSSGNVTINLQSSSSKIPIPADDVWPVMKPSLTSLKLINKMRSMLTFLLAVNANKSYAPIRMHLGDPSAGGVLQLDQMVIKAVHDTLNNRSFDGYGTSIGIDIARKAVARHFSTPKASFTFEDVIMTSGASHAIFIAMEAVANPGDNILAPTPGFPLYATIAKDCRIEIREYRAIHENNSQVDLDHLKSLINDRTKAIIINNPSNPTGSVLTKDTLQGIVNIAYNRKIIIISDEVYANIVFNGAKFYSIAEFSPPVPIIVCDSISKRYVVPGWRLGWMIFHNRYGALKDIRLGAMNLTQRVLGPSVLVQGALPGILENTPRTTMEKMQNIAGTNAIVLHKCMKKIPGLTPMPSSGSLYMVVHVNSKMYGNINDFVTGLIRQKNVYVMPGHGFNLPEWFRLVLTFSNEATREVCQRVADYCNDIITNKE